jgi:hypothetical protein
MERSLMYLIIFLFVLMLFVNIYFRIKVLRAFRMLRDSRIQFDSALVFQKDKLEQEVIARHPAHARHIRDFAHYLRLSISMAIVLIVLITLMGGLLMYYRKTG